MSGNWVPLDDSSDQILYEGSWTVINGSSRQWESAVHSTSERGARCSLWFKGIGVAVRATVPPGDLTQSFDYELDDLDPVRVSTPQSRTANYSIEVLRREDLVEDVHRLTLTNVGPAPFQVDFFEYWPGDNDPLPAAIFPPVTSDLHPPPTSTNNPLQTEETSGGEAALSAGAIAGICVGGLVLLLGGVAAFLLLKRRKKREIAISPFDPNSNNVQAPSKASPTEKASVSIPSPNHSTSEPPPGYDVAVQRESTLL